MKDQNLTHDGDRPTPWPEPSQRPQLRVLEGGKRRRTDSLREPGRPTLRPGLPPGAWIGLLGGALLGLLLWWTFAR